MHKSSSADARIYDLESVCARDFYANFHEKIDAMMYARCSL